MAMRVQGGRMVPAGSQRTKAAAVTLERMASGLDDASRSLKVEAAQTGNENLNRLAAKANALRQQVADLAKEVARA